MNQRVLFVIVLLVLLAPSAVAQTPGVAPIRRGVVTGQIRSVDGTPAAGVRVVAITADGLAQQLISQAETDASGNYRLTGIPSGRYHIAAGRLETLTYFPEGSKPAGAQIVTVTDGAVVAEIDFKLRRLPVLSGRVVGLPPSLAITELRVRLAPKASAHPPIETSVTKDGEFAFPDLPNDDYVVSLPSSRLMGVGVLIRVDDADVRGIELQPRALRVGRVVMEDGSPLPAQLVKDSRPLFKVRAGPLNGNPALDVHPDGSFFVGLLADDSIYDGRPLDYPVVVDNLDRDYAVKSIVDGSVDLLAAPLKIGNEITSREIRVTLARAAPGVKVSGTVTGVDNTAVPSRFVRIETMAQSSGAGSVAGWIGEAPIRMDGTFEILNVPPGLAMISTVPPVPGLGIPVKVGNSDLTGIKLDPTSTQDKDIDNLPLVGIDPLQLITTLPGYRARPMGHEFNSCCPSSLFVNGRLTGGMPLPEKIQLVNTEVPPGIVELFNEPGPGRVLLWAETPVDAEGRFSFWSIPLGTYEVRLLPPGVVPLSLPALNLDQLGEVRNIEIPIPARRILKGRVVLEGGGALPDPAALRVNVTGGTGVPIESDGAFTMLLPLGEYTLAVMNLPDRYFVKAITYGSTDLLHGPLHVDGPPSAEIVITLATTER